MDIPDDLKDEYYRMMNGTGTDLEIANGIAYSLEFTNYVIGITVMTAYLWVSKGAYRFHVQLRLFLLCLIGGMLTTAISRLLLVPLRLFFGAHNITIPWAKVLDYWARQASMIGVMLIDTSILTIAVERLLAAVFIRSYEHKWSSWGWILTTAIIHLTINGVFDYFLYFFRGDIFDTEHVVPILTQDKISCIVMLSCVVGMILLWIAWKKSKRHLMDPDRKLSQSFQCKENLQVINLILPIYGLFFGTRLIQLISMVSAYLLNIKYLGALGLRVILHMYSQSLALGLSLSGFLLIWLQNPIRLLILARVFRSKVAVADLNEELKKQTQTYFADLQKAWGSP